MININWVDKFDIKTDGTYCKLMCDAIIYVDDEYCVRIAILKKYKTSKMKYEVYNNFKSNDILNVTSSWTYSSLDNCKRNAEVVARKMSADIALQLKKG